MKKLSPDFFARLALPVLILIASGAVASGQGAHSAPSVVEVNVSDAPGFRVPADFTGISFEADAALPNHRGVKGYLFSSANRQLIRLFVNSGIRILRVGGGTVDIYPEAAHDRAAIDSVFSFARAAGIKVIYSLPLLNANDTADALTAKYIWTHYRDYLVCFSIGNEPNCPPYKEAPVGAIKTYRQYIAAWKTFAATILKAVPGARFAGPDSGGWDWTEEFARDEKGSGRITMITHHQYPGGRPVVHNVPLTAQQAIDSMLSPKWLTGEYPYIYAHTGEKVAPYGFSCRMTEANDYLGGIAGASNAMSSALWALDYMHWQAARGLIGINFHNNQWLKTCTIYQGPSGELLANPKAHAIRAFDLVSGGRTEPVTISNPTGVNLTAYAIKGNRYLYITIINKEHGAGARNVYATISAKGFTGGKASAMFLTAPGNDAGATSGITLGGDSITNNRPWKGQWTSLGTERNGRYNVNLAVSSAVIVRLPLY
ncbi:hypothetical protein A8C56_18685 [Niabella ginsenosidivorans]|uniref:Beta-glucuronidase C-terminal domain-containing protein n=1 Tax=Niabella ginsenosidivorans TaxID=1176587 RepID=A0A1A9I7Q8_9BACT|nr:glycosyl hydrolase family protein [Niabella ginsenosidivorans]ANH82731.1 hypothetical protein A8C56_18685 [Niabella ginsenosidivorans]